MLLWIMGLQKRPLANSETLCRSATCQHNCVTSQKFRGTYFLLAQAGQMANATYRLQMGQVAAPNGPAKTLLARASRVRSIRHGRHGRSKRPGSSDELWPNLLSRTTGRNPLGGRGRVRQLRRAVDGLDDLIGCEVMDHVAETGKNGQLALGYLLV